MSPEDLLKQNHSGQLVRKGDWPERDPVVGVGHINPICPTDYETDCLSFPLPIADKASELLRVQLGPQYVEYDRRRSGRNPLESRGSILYLNLLDVSPPAQML